MKTLATITGISLLLIVQALADVSYTAAPVKETAKGRSQVTLGKRGDTIVYRLSRYDRGKKGSFDQYIEDFYLDGKIVLRFSGGTSDRMVYCKNLDSGKVEMFYSRANIRPDKILIGTSDLKAEIFVLEQDGFYRALTDAKREAFVKSLPVDPMDRNDGEPNKALVPTATSVTPAADAPVAPAAAAAHL